MKALATAAAAARLPAGAALAAVLLTTAALAQQPHPVPDSPRWLRYEAGDGPGAGRHVVLVAADQEYRSEQALPMLAALLAAHHGCHTTVLFAQNQDGMVDPTLPIRWQDEDAQHDIPGLEHLVSADLVILFPRLITLPDEQIRHVVDYLESGKPVIGIRTANHGFLGNFPYQKDGEPVHFGRDVLGGTFLAHHGGWHRESTRGVVVPGREQHPILRGVRDVWGTSDVYRTFPEGGELPARCEALLLGQPLRGLQPDDEPNPDKEPLPIAWTTTWTGNQGRTARVFHVTMGSARDFRCADLRRLLVNATYWCLGLEDAISADSCVDCVGEYDPLPSGFDYDKLGVEPRPPADFRD